MGESRQKIAVLGGGPAAITAAFDLTATEELRDRFDVTVYQLGWRLGGKCASGRNRAHGGRIEEHGLHVWFGFYDNAFRVMSNAYDELGRPAGHPLATLEEAFAPCDEIVLYDRQDTGWHSFALRWPRNDQKPGDEHDLPTFWEIAADACAWALGRWRTLHDDRPALAPAAAHDHLFTPGWVLEVAGSIGSDALGTATRGGEHLLGLAGHLAGAHVGALGPRLPLGLRGVDVLTKLLCGFRDWLWDHAVRERSDRDPDLRLFFTIFDVFASATQGIVEDGVLDDGWDAINDRDLCEWLAQHGAKQVTVGATPGDRSPVLRSIYDVAFGYVGGQIDNANVAAGSAMNDLLRLAFSYRGSVLYKMQAGMGDTVLTPIYEVLQRRGVRFEFFHDVTGLHLGDSGRRIETIDVVRQVDLVAGARAYEPLVTVKGLECWPSEPDWDQLAGGEDLRGRRVDLEVEPNPLSRDPVQLHRGEDFDAIVLGIPVGALPPICGEIADRHPRFAKMLSTSATVRTQAFQLWLTEQTPALGYDHDPNSVTGCYVEPLDTWCDMTHLVHREAWPTSAGVVGIAYFCGVLDDRPGETDAEATERVRQNALAFLDAEVAGIWPQAVDGAPIRWSLIADPAGARDAARFDSQYWRANTTGTERYVLTPKGTVEHRLRADESGVDNLVLAGDWTRNGVDGGCVEAAVLSGMQAARALIAHTRRFTGEDPRWLAP